MSCLFATKEVGSMKVFKIWLSKRTMSPKNAYEKNVSGLHFESYLISLMLDMLWCKVAWICEDNCYRFLCYSSFNFPFWDLFYNSW